MIDGSVVYYISIADHIKIGTTKNFRPRMQALRPDAILAVEPGGLELEAQRHAQFRVDRIRNERFRPSDGLLQHIDSVAAEFPVPELPYQAPRPWLYSPSPVKEPSEGSSSEPISLSGLAEAAGRHAEAHDELVRLVRIADKNGTPKARVAEAIGMNRATVLRYCTD